MRTINTAPSDSPISARPSLLLCRLGLHRWELSPVMATVPRETVIAYLDWCKRPGCFVRRVREPIDVHPFKRDPDYPKSCWHCGREKERHA